PKTSISCIILQVLSYVCAALWSIGRKRDFLSIILGSNRIGMVYTTDWPGLGIQKQRALDKASGDWVLSIDADEAVTPELKKEIIQAIGHGNFDAYKIPRMTIFCGHPIKRGRS
ncbi:glycosyltransferase, partial [Bathymodiolus heckerae thiotrophic gill symbiont]|uniref:glycosyltransferase n=1 Tax=Bathymodiolus heckerae thiotrophic gill symbiont TaxID=1052212 RepID=UPI001BB28299